MTIGKVITSFGRSFIVDVNSTTYEAVTKGKKNDFVVGDIVEVQIINNEQAQILKLLERNNLVFRSNSHRMKIIASNVTQLLIVIAVKPNFNINFLNRCLVFAHSQNITPVIVINKNDLEESGEFISSIQKLYQDKLHYKVISISTLNEDINKLIPMLNNNQSLLIGQSGVGKSSITNYIIPNAHTITNTITKSETSGKHTTTHASLFNINDTSFLIDCPGLHEFGLSHISTTDIINYFPELEGLQNKCKFRDCKHHLEPGCVILKALQDNMIGRERFKFLQQITLECNAKSSHWK